MNTLNGMEITYEHSFALLEAIKESFHEGDEIISLFDYCEQLLSDSRLDVYPDIELSGCNVVIFNYENYDDELPSYNHLVIKIKTYGLDYDDKILSYYYIKDDITDSNKNVSWNEVLKIIEKWHK